MVELKDDGVGNDDCALCIWKKSGLRFADEVDAVNVLGESCPKIVNGEKDEK